MTRNTDTQSADSPQSTGESRGAGGTDGGGASDEDGASDRHRARRPVLPVETVVREGEAVAAACPYCDQPFPDERGRDLHVGEAHASECTDAERAGYEAARDAEEDELFYFHLRVVGALGVLYAFLVLVYMVALGSGFI